MASTKMDFSNDSYTSVRNKHILQLKAEYDRYLRSYLSNYRKYLLAINKNFDTRPAGDASKFKSAAAAANQQLMKIVTSLKRDNQNTQSKAQQAMSEADQMNQEIDQQAADIACQQENTSGQRDKLYSKDQMIQNDVEKNRYKYKIYILYVILNLTVIIIFLSLLIKMYNQ